MNPRTHPAATPTLLGRTWATVGSLAAWLDNVNGTGENETALRLLKLTEEVGEVASAYIGATGQNPRKGVTHTRHDVADELCDVIVTAMVALHRFTPDPERHFAVKVQRIADRAALHCTCDGPGDGACPAHLDPDHGDGRLAQDAPHTPDSPSTLTA